VTVALIIKMQPLVLKGIVDPKIKKFCHYLFTVMLFQTCIHLLLVLNKKEDILKNVTRQLLVPIDFHRETFTMEITWVHQLFGYRHSSK